MGRTRIGALEVVPNVPTGSNAPWRRVEQKLQHETDTQNLGKRKILLLVFMQFAVTTFSKMPPGESGTINTEYDRKHITTVGTVIKRVKQYIIMSLGRSQDE